MRRCATGSPTATERLVDFAMHPDSRRDGRGCVSSTRPGSTSPSGRVPRKRCVRERPRSARSRSVCSARCCPGRLIVPAGVSVAARYEAASAALEVGGDWYDVFALADGRVALTVGDVVGHGLAAAAAMGQLRTALAALARYTESPGELLTRLDAFVATTDTTDFATVCYGVLDPATGVFEYASAGHPPILLVSPNGETRWLDEAQSPPLCGDEERHASTGQRDSRAGLAARALLGRPDRASRRAVERPPRSAQDRRRARWSGCRSPTSATNSSSLSESRRRARTTWQYSPSSSIRSPEEDSTSSFRPNRASFASSAPRCVTGWTSGTSVRQTKMHSCSPSGRRARTRSSTPTGAEPPAR